MDDVPRPATAGCGRPESPSPEPGADAGSKLQISSRNKGRLPARGGRPLALYVHLPWCVAKCPYCDFNSHPLARDTALPAEAYVDALLRDLAFELRQRPEARTLVSVFLGGGTPSLFPPSSIARLLDGVASQLPIGEGAEISIEANPGTADAANFRGYRSAGVNRISLGLQSFSDAKLAALGRIHDAAQGRRAFGLARAAGFTRINVDLMFALPRQTHAEALEDLAQAAALGPEHLSWYQLTVEPSTPFAARPPPLPDDEQAFVMQREGLALLAGHGYRRYEVSAFARSGDASIHNLNYWRFGDYLGIGAGAHGKRTRTGDGTGGLDIERCSRRRDPRAYAGNAGTAAAVAQRRCVPADELPFEYAMNALRLVDGFPLTDFERATGLDRRVLAPALSRAGERGLVERVGDRVRATVRGLDMLNDVLQMFLPRARTHAA